MKQFKNKQQEDKLPNNKCKQANKLDKKRKFQPDCKSDASAAQKPKWDDFEKKEELKQNGQYNDRTNDGIIVWVKQIWEILRR